MQVWRLLAHNHWFTLRLFNYKIRLCARCSGYLTGLFIYYTIPIIRDLKIMQWSQSSSVYYSLLLSTPVILDWLTQAWGIRTSSNPLRFLTGISMGIGLGLFSQISSGSLVEESQVIILFLIISATGILGYKRVKCVCSNY